MVIQSSMVKLPKTLGALPETLILLVQQKVLCLLAKLQIRYTTGSWSFSIENPESTITTQGGARVATDDAAMPDFTARYTHKADWGELVVTGLARQLTYKKNGIDADESSFGIISVPSGKVNFGQNNLKFMLTQGSGLGRYVGLNVAHGAVLDGDDPDAIDSTSGFIAYQQHWNSQWRSTFLYSFFSADNNTDLLAMSIDPTKTSQSFSANIIVFTS